MLAFGFGLSFVFGTYIGHYILSFLLYEKKQKIVAEIDLVLKKYGSTADFCQLMHSEKPGKKEV